MSGLVLILLIVFTVLFWLAIIGATGWKPTPAAKPAAKPSPAPQPAAQAAPAASPAPPPPAPAAPAPAPPPAASETAAADDLTKISGIGPAISKKLNAMGVTSYAQIAAWTRDEVEEVDGKLNFKGRIDREEWIEQAQKLAGG